MKKIVVLLLLFCLMNSLLVCAAPTPTPAPTGAPTPAPTVEPVYEGSATVTILQTSDIHGHFQQDPEKGILGYSGIAAIQRSLPDSILVDSGDYLSSDMFQAQDTVGHVLSLMNAVGYHVAGVGEADLLNGAEVLRDVQSRAAFHMLSTNVTTGTDRTHLLGNTKIINVKGIRLGFFSIISPELRLTSGLEDLDDIYLEDASKTAQASVNQLKQQGADVIIALTHIGNKGESTVDQLAAFVSGIDYIFDGHDHQEASERMVGDTMILTAGSNGKQLMQLDLKFGANKKLLTVTTVKWGYAALKDLPVDEAIVRLENQIAEEQSSFLNEEVAVSRTEISYDQAIGYQSVALGNFIADAYRYHTKATVALIDAGSIAGSIPLGSVTKADILAVLPNNNTVQTKKITPKDLRVALESGLSDVCLKEDGTIDPESLSNKFPQISGMTVSVNLKNEPGERVVRMKLDNGVSLNLSDDRSLVTVASNSSLMSGENDYDILSMSPLNEEFGSEGQALLEYLNSPEEYVEYSESRIRMTDQQKSYTGIIVTMFLGLILIVMVLLVVIKVMTRVH